MSVRKYERKPQDKATQQLREERAETQEIHGAPEPQEFGPGGAETFQVWCDNAADLVYAGWDAPAHPGAGVEDRRKQREAPDSFCGASEPEARKVVLNGWPEGARIVQALADGLEHAVPEPKSRKRTLQWGEEGDEADRERAEAGLAPWRQNVRKMRASIGTVEIVAEWGLDCGATFENLKWSGAALVAVTELLERAGYSVDAALVGACRSRGNYEKAVMFRVQVKEAGEPLDIEKAAALACYPPAWRHYGLGLYQQSPFGHTSSYHSHSHGSVFAYEPDGMWARPGMVTVAMRTAVNEQAARENVKRALKVLEVTLKRLSGEDTEQAELELAAMR